MFEDRYRKPQVIYNHTLATVLILPGSFPQSRGRKPDSSHFSLTQLFLIVLPGAGMTCLGTPEASLLVNLCLYSDSSCTGSLLLFYHDSYLLSCVSYMTHTLCRKHSFPAVENMKKSKLGHMTMIISMNPLTKYILQLIRNMCLTIEEIWAIYILCLTWVLKYIWFQR